MIPSFVVTSFIIFFYYYFDIEALKNMYMHHHFHPLCLITKMNTIMIYIQYLYVITLRC